MRRGTPRTQVLRPPDQATDDEAAADREQDPRHDLPSSATRSTAACHRTLGAGSDGTGPKSTFGRFVRTRDAYTRFGGGRLPPTAAREGALRPARTDLRPLREAPLVRTRPALAPLPRLPHRRPGPARQVLDVATGTGAVALELLPQKAARVVGLDQSPEMLAEARRRAAGRGPARRGRGRPPAVPGRLIRRAHVHLPAALRRRSRATLRELARVVRPAARSPGSNSACRRTRPRESSWRLYVGVGLPLAGRLISPGWQEVGDFLGPSIEKLWRGFPLERLLELWRRGRDRGRSLPTAEPRRRDRHLGSPSMSAEARPAFYALGREAGATTSRCCTRRTRSGI